MTSALNPIAIGTTPGDNTGDAARSGMIKVKSDHSTFLASIGRRPTKPGTFGVTSSAGSTTVLNDTTQAWAVNQFAGQTLDILTGSQPVSGSPTSNLSYGGTIASNTATSITLSAALPFAIGSGVGYQVPPVTLNAGSDGSATTAGGTGPSTLVDAAQAWTVNQWEGQGVTLLAGAYAGQSSPIISNTATALTLAVAFANAIAAGTPYAIGPLPLINNFSSTLPATLATSTNNLAVAGWGPGIDRLRLAAASGGSTLTGLVSTGFADGAPVVLRNTSSTDIITLDHLNGGSAAANQFSLPGAAAFVLPPLTGCLLVYDASEPNSSGAGAWTLAS
jgi:hypothetical protein